MGSLGKVQGGYWTLHGHGFLYTYIIYTYNCVEQIYLIVEQIYLIVGISIPYYTYLIISIDHTHNYMIIYYIYICIYILCDYMCLNSIFIVETSGARGGAEEQVRCHRAPGGGTPRRG